MLTKNFNTVLIVGHAGINQHIINYLLKKILKNYEKQPNCALSIFETKNGIAIINELNSTAHLA